MAGGEIETRGKERKFVDVSPIVRALALPRYAVKHQKKNETEGRTVKERLAGTRGGIDVLCAKNLTRTTGKVRVDYAGELRKSWGRRERILRVRGIWAE